MSVSRIASTIRLRTPCHDYGEVTLGLRGAHQMRNAVVAVRVLETLNARGVAEALRRDLGKVVPELRRIHQTVNERRAADRAGNLGECLRHCRPTHDDAKETRCRSTPPG